MFQKELMENNALREKFFKVKREKEGVHKPMVHHKRLAIPNIIRDRVAYYCSWVKMIRLE